MKAAWSENGSFSLAELFLEPWNELPLLCALPDARELTPNSAPAERKDAHEPRISSADFSTNEFVPLVSLVCECSLKRLVSSSASISRRRGESRLPIIPKPKKGTGCLAVADCATGIAAAVCEFASSSEG